MYVGGGLGRLIGGILPNSYYSRPKYRFPYYDNNGKERMIVFVIIFVLFYRDHFVDLLYELLVVIEQASNR